MRCTVGVASDYPDGVPTIDILDDLRFIKLSKSDRGMVLHLQSEYRSRNFTADEDAWVRRLARRRVRAIRELHGSYERARATEAKARMGEREYARVMREAKRGTRLMRLKKLQMACDEARAARESMNDFGI